MKRFSAPSPRWLRWHAPDAACVSTRRAHATLRQRFASPRWLLLFCLMAFGCAVGCAAPADPVDQSSSNVDTTGCSGLTMTRVQGPVEVSTGRPPTRSCWNIPDSGLTLTYSWMQRTGAPERDNIGFWTSLNGADVYAKAESYGCSEVFGGGLGHDTSGQRSFRCTAWKRFTFGKEPKLLDAAYFDSGHRRSWEVRAAVSLDDNGTWDSLNGANYRFDF